HVVLTRSLAASGHFPAIDILESRSRVRDELIDAPHRRAANVLQRLVAAYQEKSDLISIGAYHRGADPIVDAAIEHRDVIQRFLQQPPDERSSFDAARAT